MQEDFVAALKCNLRTLTARASKSAGSNDTDKEEYGYGMVWPFVFVLAATTVPPPMHPKCMWSISSAK